MSYLGIIFGFVVVIGGALCDGDPLASLFSTTALIIVVGGTVAALLTNFGLSNLITGFKGAVWLFKPPTEDLRKFVDDLAGWAAIYNRKPLDLEPLIDDIRHPIIKQALRMLVDNAKDEYRHTLMIMSEKISDKEKLPGEIFEAAGGFAPTIGVMGAVMGLIHVMMLLSHPELLGEGVATAFVATVYGVGGANLILIPMGGRLGQIAEESEKQRGVMLHGLMLLQEGKMPSVIRDEMEPMLDEAKKAKDGTTNDEGGE